MFFSFFTIVRILDCIILLIKICVDFFKIKYFSFILMLQKMVYSHLNLNSQNKFKYRISFIIYCFQINFLVIVDIINFLNTFLDNF